MDTQVDWTQIKHQSVIKCGFQSQKLARHHIYTRYGRIANNAVSDIKGSSSLGQLVLVVCVNSTARCRSGIPSPLLQLCLACWSLT